MFLRCFFVLMISLGLALPAQAVLTLGVAAERGSQVRSESGARQLADQLQGLVNEEVRLRVFRTEAELNEWMQRYRIVDLAWVSRGYYNKQPAGSLILLTQPAGMDLAVARPGLKPETLARLRSAMPALKLDIPGPPPQRATLPAPKRARKPAQTLARPSDGELQPGQEILAIPGQTPRMTAQPAPSVRRTTPRLQKPAAPRKVASVNPAPQVKTAASAAKKPAPAIEKPAPVVATAPIAPKPAPALVLPPSTPAATEPPVTPPAITNQESTAAPVAAPVATQPPLSESKADGASAVPWLGLLVLLGGFGYLFYRRRQKARPIDWSAVNLKKPRPVPATAPQNRPPLPSRPRLEEDAATSQLSSLSRVPLPPSRKAVEAAAAPAAEPIKVADAIALAQEVPSSSDAMAALLTDDAPAEFNDYHQSGELPSLATEELPSLELQIPALELDDATAAVAAASPPFSSSLMVEPEPGVEIVEEKDAFFTKKPGKPSSDLPPLRGDIATVSIPRLLEAAAGQPGPCILNIRGRHDEKRLHFRLGHLSDAASVNRANRAKTGFLMNKGGYLLIRQGRITEEQRDQALRLCEERPKLRIGEALVELGALSRESLLEALQTQAEGVIFSLFIFPAGRYEIVADDADTPAANDLNIDLVALLNKAETQEPEWERIRQAIPSLDAILDFPEGGRDKLDSARMTEHQKLVLSLINGHRPIRDICIAATMLDLEVYKFLFFMVNAKILTRVSAG